MTNKQIKEAVAARVQLVPCTARFLANPLDGENPDTYREAPGFKVIVDGQVVKTTRSKYLATREASAVKARLTATYREVHR